MRHRALLIGVDAYEQPSVFPLTRPVRDIELIAETLTDSVGHLFDSDDVEVLKDPTLALALERLTLFFRRAEADQTLLVYFAGHGAHLRDQLHLLLADSDPDRPRTMLSADSLQSLLEATNATSVLLIFDTTNAGSFALPDASRVEEASTSYHYIGSVGPTEGAFDDSPFAQAVADALSEATASGNGELRPDQLFSFVRDRLSTEPTHPFYASREPAPAMDLAPAGTATIFVSYAHEDKDWLKKLRPHLESMVMDNSDVDYWDDSKINSGDDWRWEIKEKLLAANAAVLLVSANFLASEFIRNSELPDLLAQAEDQKTRLFAVIVRPCRFKKVIALSRFQPINAPSKALSGMRKHQQEEIFVRLTDQLEQALQ